MGRAPRGWRSRGAPGGRRAGGPSDGRRTGARTRRWDEDTQALGFSATKGLASMVLHRLADRGELAYDEPVASYWPAFAAEGKQHITVRELLSHRANLYDVQAVAHSAEDLLDHIGMEERLAAAMPQGPPSRPAYHALTFGWLASGARPRHHRQGDARAGRRGARGAARSNRVGDRLPQPALRRTSSAPRCGSTAPWGTRPPRCWGGYPSPEPGSAHCTPPGSKASAAGPSRGSGRPRCRRSTAR